MCAAFCCSVLVIFNIRKLHGESRATLARLCCSLLQSVAGCCSARVTVFYSVLKCVWCSALQFDDYAGYERATATHCNTLQHTATHCNTLQHTATHPHGASRTTFMILRCSVLQCVAVRVLLCVCCSACVAVRVLQCMYRSLLQCAAVRVKARHSLRNFALQCVAVCCSACVAVRVLQCMHRSLLQCAAARVKTHHPHLPLHKILSKPAAARVLQPCVAARCTVLQCVRSHATLICL